MNLLGGMGLAWWFLVEWFTRPMSMVYLSVSHLWMATQETKRFEMSNVEKLQVQPLGIMGSAWIT